MKKTLLSVAYLLMGAIIFTACADEKTGKSTDQVVDQLAIEPEDESEAALADLDTVPEMEVKAIPPPPPRPVPPSPPRVPWIDPDPGPDPEPWPKLIQPTYQEPVKGDPVIEFVEVEAEFPGGAAALMMYIQKNITYPPSELENEVQGRVFVEFIVEKDGSITGVKVLRGVSSGLDKEAMRVVRSMPKWKPAEAGGKIVRSKMRLPFTFTLQ